MSAFVDTGAPVAFRNPRDERHERAVELVEDLKEGRRGAVFTSDYIFDEAISLAQARSKREDVVRAVGEAVLPKDPNDRWILLLHVSPDEFFGAWASVCKFGKARLSLTDWTTVELMRRRGIDEVVSFDSGFDAWLRRVS